jgi:hypothetical protein
MIGVGCSLCIDEEKLNCGMHGCGGLLAGTSSILTVTGSRA